MANRKPDAPEPLVIPVVEERVQVGTRSVETDRVLIRTHVETREEQIERALRADAISVERVAIGREVEAAPEVREENGVLIVPVLEEELVVRKRLILKEELRISGYRTTRPVRKKVRLRREVVDVERAAARRSSNQGEDSDGSDT